MSWHTHFHCVVSDQKIKKSSNGFTGELNIGIGGQSVGVVYVELLTLMVVLLHEVPKDEFYEHDLASMLLLHLGGVLQVNMKGLGLLNCPVQLLYSRRGLNFLHCTYNWIFNSSSSRPINWRAYDFICDPDTASS